MAQQPLAAEEISAHESLVDEPPAFSTSDGGITTLIDCASCGQRVSALAFTSHELARPAGERRCAHCVRAARLRDEQDGGYGHGQSQHMLGEVGAPRVLTQLEVLEVSRRARARAPQAPTRRAAMGRLAQWSNSSHVKTVEARDLPRHARQPPVLSQAEVSASVDRMMAAAEASRAKRALLRQDLLAAERAEHGPQKLHARRLSAEAIRRWTKLIKSSTC